MKANLRFDVPQASAINGLVYRERRVQLSVFCSWALQIQRAMFSSMISFSGSDFVDFI
jgi:hypothetical protein